MVPARNLLRRHYDTYGGYALMSSSPPMAEESEDQDPAAPAGPTTKNPQDDTTWLQLGIGSSSSSSSSSSSTYSATAAAPPRSLELNLFSPSHPTTATPHPPIPPSSSVPMSSTFAPHYTRLGQWGYWSAAAAAAAGSSSTSSLPPPPRPQYYPNPLYAAGGSSELRVVGLPSRRQPAVWFFLQAAKNQVREPFLQQIPKSYLRIKDGRMTVRLLIKYLTNKLGLDEESEVEISCRGQLLHPYMTLQHVRDEIWCSREAAAFLTDSSAPTDHVMTLQYGRSG